MAGDWLAEFRPSLACPSLLQRLGAWCRGTVPPTPLSLLVAPVFAVSPGCNFGTSSCADTAPCCHVPLRTYLASMLPRSQRQMEALCPFSQREGLTRRVRESRGRRIVVRCHIRGRRTKRHARSRRSLSTCPVIGHRKQSCPCYVVGREKAAPRHRRDFWWPNSPNVARSV